VKKEWNIVPFFFQGKVEIKVEGKVKVED